MGPDFVCSLINLVEKLGQELWTWIMWLVKTQVARNISLNLLSKMEKMLFQNMPRDFIARGLKIMFLDFDYFVRQTFEVQVTP